MTQTQRSTHRIQRTPLTAFLAWLLVQIVLVAATSSLSSFSDRLYDDPLFGSYTFINFTILSFLFFAVFSTLSVLSSWLIVPRLLGERIGKVRWLLISTCIFFTLVISPNAYFSTPVYGYEALGYYSVLALLGCVVVILQVLYRVPKLRTVFSAIFSTLESDAAELTSSSKSVTELSKELRHHAQSYRNQSKFSIAMILVALLVGAAVFVAADAIAAMNIDQELRSVVTQLRRAQNFQRSITQSVSDLASYSDLIDILKKYNNKLGEIDLTPDELSLLEAQYKKIDKIAIPSDSTSLYRTVLDEFAVLERSARHVVGTLLSEVEQSAVEIKLIEILDNRSEEDNTRAILSTLSTRLGSIFLVIFLVRILTAIFRHSARMAAHYESCADICSLGEVSKTDAMSILYADDIGFDKVPKSPMSEITEIVQKAVDAARTKA